MIQRIQSIYLLLVTILMAVTAFSPLLILRAADLTTIDMCAKGFFDGVEGLLKPTTTWGVVSIAALSALAAFINIFLYKKRKVQIKVGILTSFLIVFFYITTFVYFYVYTNENGLELSSIHYGIVLPFVALIFNLLAIGKIKSDEKLVNSLNRIR